MVELQPTHVSARGATGSVRRPGEAVSGPGRPRLGSAATGIGTRPVRAGTDDRAASEIPVAAIRGRARGWCRSASIRSISSRRLERSSGDRHGGRDSGTDAATTGDAAGRGSIDVG
jgi:hypothetical protein